MATFVKRRETREVRIFSEVEAAWLAAIIDGEGSPRIDNRANPRPGYRYPRLMIINTCLPLLWRVEEIANVGFITRRKRKQAVHHCDQCQWQVCGWRCVEVLRQVLPWLIVKRDLAT